MIDVHCHIIPGVDDGARTLEESIALVRTEAEGGTRTFIATPHVIERRDYDRLEAFAEGLEALRAGLAEAEIAVDLALGGEIYPNPHVLAALDAGRPLTLVRKGRHMLVDLPLGALPRELDGLLFEIQARGITPILAHPERAEPFQEDPERLAAYVERRIAIQVNGGSLFGRYGPRAAATARRILRSRRAHFLASDCHRPRNVPILGSAAAVLRTELGAEYVELLTEGSARCVLEGRELPPLPLAPEKPRGPFGRLFSRRPR